MLDEMVQEVHNQQQEEYDEVTTASLGAIPTAKVEEAEAALQDIMKRINNFWRGLVPRWPRGLKGCCCL